MISHLDSLAFERLLWLVPMFFAIHNLEEATFMERGLKGLPWKIHPLVTSRQFGLAVTILTLVVFFLTCYALDILGNSTGHLLVLGVQAILLVNAFIPHIAATILFRMYSPGVITAILLTLPFSYYLLKRALSEAILSLPQFWILLLVAPFAMVIFAAISLGLGKVLDK